jgi:thiamine transport system permease protein
MDADHPPVGGRHGAGGAAPGRASRAAAAAFGGLPVLFLCLFLLYPLSRILGMGLGPLIAGGADAVRKVCADTDIGRLLLASAGQALLSTVLTFAVGMPIAYIFSHYSFPGKAALRTLLVIPFVLPSIVVSAAFVELIGSGGLLARAVLLLTGIRDVSLSRTLAAVLLAHVFYNAAIVVRMVGGAWSSLDPRLAEAGRTLGAGRVSAFLTITLRLLLPSIAAASLLVFAFCFSSFGIILVLGGPRIMTLETEIYRQAVYMFNLPAAAFLSVTQILITAAVMYGYSRIQARMSVVVNLRPETLNARSPRTPGEHLLVLACGVCPLLCLLLPLGALLLGSVLTRSGFTLASWKALFSGTGHSLFWTSPLRAALNSLFFSFETMLISLSLGIPAAYIIARGQRDSTGLRRWGASALDLLFLLPLGTSAVTLGFGFIISMGILPASMRNTPLLIPLAHSLVALPLVIRSLLAPLQSINPRMREAAALLGAGPMRVRLEIDVPLLHRAFISAAAFAFTVSLGEFGATAILTRPDLMTLPVLIYNSLSRPGELNQGQALALSSLLMAACGAGLAAIERFRTGGTEVF